MVVSAGAEASERMGGKMKGSKVEFGTVPFFTFKQANRCER